MAKRMSVLTFLTYVDFFSDHIPVTVLEGQCVLFEAESLKWLESHGTLYVLEATLLSAKIDRQMILLRVRGKEYNFRPQIS